MQKHSLVLPVYQWGLSRLHNGDMRTKRSPTCLQGLTVTSAAFWIFVVTLHCAYLANNSQCNGHSVLILMSRQSYVCWLAPQLFYSLKACFNFVKQTRCRKVMSKMQIFQQIRKYDLCIQITHTKVPVWEGWRRANESAATKWAGCPLSVGSVCTSVCMGEPLL